MEPFGPDECPDRPSASHSDRRPEDEQRLRPVHAGIGRRRRRAGAEAGAAGNRQLLLADAGQTFRDRARRSVCTPRADPRDPGRARSSHNRSMKQEGAAEAPFLATPLQYLKGVGPRRAADFERAGLKTVEDLLYRFPIRYEDRSRLQTIASLKPGQPASISSSEEHTSELQSQSNLVCRLLL